METDILPVWNQLNERLYNFVNQQVNDQELAKDIVQDVFVKAFSKLDTLRNKDRMVSWIYQITRNEINTHFRKHRYESSSEDIPELAQEEDNLTADFLNCITPMIASLPKKYQEAIQLSEIENISQKAIAERLDISYSGAKSRVQRGREALKNLLQECCTISTDKYGNIIDYHEKDCNGSCN